MRSFRRIIATTLFLSAPFVAAQGCASRGPDLAARMASAKMAYESVGYTTSGSPAMGMVAEGADSKVPLSLKEGCYQIVTFAGDGLKGVDVALNDPAGKPVGEVKKQETQTSIKHCVTEAATYNLIIKSSGGTGSFIAQPYVSGEKANAAKSGDDTNPDNGCVGDDCGDDNSNPGGGDPCSNAIDLTAGNSTKGNTVGKGYAPHATCAAGEGAAVVYRVHVEGRHKLVLDLSAKFDAVMSLFRAAQDGYLCDSGYEVDCSDDSEGLTTKSRLDAIVDTGDYGVLISGYDGQSDRGDFELKTRLEDAPSLESVCTGAHLATIGGKTTEFVGSEGSNFRSSCGTSDGAEALFKFDLKGRSRVRLGMKSSTGGESSISVRKRCEDPNTEIACSKDWHIDGLSWTGLMDAGAYTAITETTDASHSASIDFNIDRSDANGAGTAEGDACKDAKPLPLGSTFTIDTFQAKGDMKASCASDAAADVAYKIEVKSKSRLFLSTQEDEAHHVFAVQKACGETKGEVVCEPASVSKGVDTTLDPGNYFLVVKGKGPDDFGRTKVSAKLRELAPAAAACKGATKLVSGTPVNDTTTAAPDRFASEKCGGNVWSQASGDKVYQFTLKDRSKVNLTLKNAFYNAIMSLRQDCGDPTRSEIVCSTYYNKTIDRELEPGTYYVVVDGFGAKSEGAFTLEMTAKSVK